MTGTGFTRVCRLASVMLASALLAGCSHEVAAPPSPRPSRTQSPSPTAGEGVWLAGLRVAADPNDLEESLRRVKRSVAEASVVLSPLTCYTGLPKPFVRSGYVLGIIGGSKQEVDALVAKTGVHSLFEVPVVKHVCLD